MTMKSRKFPLELSSGLADELDQLAKEQHVTKAELMRRALSLLKIALDEKADGGKLTIANRENVITKEIVLS